MRILFLAELVAAVALGLGASGMGGADPNASPYAPNHDWRMQVRDRGERAELMFGMVLGLGTWAGAARRREAVPWGPGRRALAAFAVFVPVVVGSYGVESVAAFKRWGDPRPYQAFFGGLVRYGALSLGAVPWFLLALALTGLASRPPAPAPADAREWAGRAFVAVVIVAHLTMWVMDVFNLGPHRF